MNMGCWEKRAEGLTPGTGRKLSPKAVLPGTSRDIRLFPSNSAYLLSVF